MTLDILHQYLITLMVYFFPLICLWNLPYCSSLPLPTMLLLCTFKKTPALSSSDQAVVDGSAVCPSASFLQAEQIRLSQPFIIWPVLQVLDQLGGLCGTHSSVSIPILHWGAQNRTQYSRCGLKSAEQSGRITPLDLLVTLFLMQPSAAITCCWLVINFLSTTTPMCFPAELLPRRLGPSL